jgi:hypothetical protein
MMFKKRRKHGLFFGLFGREIVDRPSVQYNKKDPNVCEVLYPDGELAYFDFPEEGRPDLMRISFRIISKST